MKNIMALTVDTDQFRQQQCFFFVPRIVYGLDL